MFLLILLILPSAISLSSSMLTCKTPPNAIPSKQLVKLTTDSVERHAPVLFTYNPDPIIKDIQPSRSFVRLENEVHRFTNGLDITLCQCQLG